MKEKSVDDFLVVENIQLNSTNFLIRMEAPIPLPIIHAGQFVNVEVKDCSEIFLRRPFSVYDVDYKKNHISIIVKILGRGSYKLARSKKGDIISLIYPLGQSFTYPVKTEKILLIGGGSGVAPMLFLAKESGLSKNNVDILLGARTSDDHIDVSDYREYGNIQLTTDDGSEGFKGTVTMHPLVTQELSKYSKIYACGPLAMMKAVAFEASAKEIFCEVSLENNMACGFGVCLCCIEPTVRGNVCVCTEGPVFNIKDLKWQN
jgi:dihydroorotate dehydrogenase electron transfer subunit